MGLGDESWNLFQYGSTGGFWVYGRKVLLGMISLRRGIPTRVDIISLRKGISAHMDIVSLYRDILVAPHGLRYPSEGQGTLVDRSLTPASW